MDLDWLRDFLALADEKNFSRAADARHITQPAFSRRIRALEDWIGTPLFERSAQGAILTPAGTYFRPIAEELTHTLRRAQRETRAVGARETASLSIAATHVLSFTFFPGWIRKRIRIEALGTLNLISDSMEACEEIMLAGEVDFLLCHYHADAPARFDPDRFQSIVVGSDILVPVSAPNAKGDPLWPLDGGGRQTRLLAYSQASGLGRILAAHPVTGSETGGTETVFTSHHAATLMSMARQGHGVAWLPLTLIEDDLACDRLVRAGSEGDVIAVEIRLFRSIAARSPAASDLWSDLVEEVGQHPVKSAP